MTVTITNPYPYGPLSPERLQAFESKIGVPLPSDHRKFLEMYNGGQPNPSGFWIIDGHDGSSIQQFYGLHNGPEWFSIDGYTNVEWGIPQKLLPIGDDGVGNLICIGVKDKEKGAIYFIDHEIHPYDEPDSFEGITKLADSFSDFLSNLRIISE